MEKIHIKTLPLDVQEHLKTIEKRYEDKLEEDSKELNLRGIDYYTASKYYTRERRKAQMEYLLSIRTITDIPEHTKKCKKCLGTGRIGYKPHSVTLKDGDGKVHQKLDEKGKPVIKNIPILCKCVIEMID